MPETHHPSLPVAADAAHTAGAVRSAWPGVGLSAGAHDGLTPVQRQCLVVAILALHGAAGWGLLQVHAVRDAVALAAPMFVDLIAPPAPPVPAPPPSPPQLPKPVVKAPPPPPAPLIAAAPAPVTEPVAFVVPPPPPALPPPVEVPQPTPVVVAAPPAPPPAPPPLAAPAPPKLIPASAVQYLEPPAPDFPRTSRRLGESGRVLLRVYIDEAGLPRQVLVAQSSGFARLDDAAVAAMKKARFRPYTEHGQPTAGWAPAPIAFELEK